MDIYEILPCNCAEASCDNQGKLMKSEKKEMKKKAKADAKKRRQDEKQAAINEAHDDGVLVDGCKCDLCTDLRGYTCPGCRTSGLDDYDDTFTCNTCDKTFCYMYCRAEFQDRRRSRGMPACVYCCYTECRKP